MTRSQPKFRSPFKVRTGDCASELNVFKISECFIDSAKGLSKNHCKLLQFLLGIRFTWIMNMLGLKHHRTVGGEFYGHDWQCKCQIKQSGYIMHREYYNHRNNMATTELNGSGKSERTTRPKHDAVSCSAGGWLGCLTFYFFSACLLMPLVTYRR